MYWQRESQALIYPSKSLTDWLTLDGYEELAFVADVADGTKRLWNACKIVYKDTDSLKSISDFEITPEKMFALENGGKYLVNVSSGTDFEWLVNTKINALKFRFCGDLGIDYFDMLNDFKHTLSVDLYWSIAQHAHICAAIRDRSLTYELIENKKHISCRSYLHCLANAYYQFVSTSLNSQSAVIDLLNEEKEIWLDEVANVETSSYKILSDAVIPASYKSSSPNDKLLVCLTTTGRVQVFELPNLKKIFELNVSRKHDGEIGREYILTFSPDSSYFLYNSIKTCICFSKQEELDFIPHGPDEFRSCSFSSCGTKLVTSHEFIEVWDVQKKDLLVRVQDTPEHGCCFFSSCNKLILELTGSDLCSRDSRTLQKSGIHRRCYEKCFTNDVNFQIIPFENEDMVFVFDMYHFHLTTGEIAIGVGDNISRKPFRFKGRTCLLFSHYPFISLLDVIRQVLIYSFRIDRKSFDGPSLDFSMKLDGTNFLFVMNRHTMVVSFETLQEPIVESRFKEECFNCACVSPDNLYIARCCDEVLTITNVESGVTVQTVELQHFSVACWWSELFLFVVCGDVVVKFSYDPVRSNVLGNCVEECAINVGDELKSGEGVFVFGERALPAHEYISILKICDNKLFSQQKISSDVFDAKLISSDGCAILLEVFLHYKFVFELWEFSTENGWELDTAEDFDDLHCLFLTGTRNSRTLFGRTTIDNAYVLFDFSSRKLSKFPSLYSINRVYNVGASFLLASSHSSMIYVYDDNTVTTLDTLWDMMNNHGFFSFYFSSKGLLIFVWRNHYIIFKIRNVQSCLES